MTTLAQLILRHICERPGGGPDKLDHPDTIVTTVNELNEAVEYVAQEIEGAWKQLSGLRGGIISGHYRERFDHALRTLEALVH